MAPRKHPWIYQNLMQTQQFSATHDLVNSDPTMRHHVSQTSRSISGVNLHCSLEGRASMARLGRVNFRKSCSERISRQ